VESREKYKLKNLRITTISLMIIDFFIAIISPFLFRYEYFLAKYLVIFLFNVLIPLTSFFMIVTFIYNLRVSYIEKRTKEQELIIRQRFWGRIWLLGISTIIIFIYIFFKDFDLVGIIIMFSLIFLSLLIGPFFGKLIIRK